MQDLESPVPDGSFLNAVEADSVEDRLSILHLISVYSHLVDDFDPATWGELFTEDARFEIRYARDATGDTIVVEGRDAILGVIVPRQSRFRGLGIQRRHFLTNPVVLDNPSDSARVMAYLMLANIDPEHGMQIEGTGRYDGIVVRTAAGWKIQQWRLTADGRAIGGDSSRSLEAPED